jgi:hypothetical protein
MRNRLAVSLACLIISGCTADRQEVATVQIEAPQDGAVIQSDSLRVQLSASGIEIVPADGSPTPGRAHHHIFLDADLTPADEPIHAGMEGVFHLGTGDSNITLHNLTPGRHRLIAVLALGNHVPVQPWAVDTVYFSVEPPM